MSENIISVTQLNSYVKSLIEYSPLLNSVWVKGEISNFKHHSSGHMYLTLKDEGGVLKAVMFKGNAAGLNFTPEDGMKVLAHGRVSVYEVGGVYQLYIDQMEPDGVGALYIAFEQLKEKLEKEGLFKEEYKKEIPRYPKKVGVVTSKTGAAVRDIINVIKRRCPLCDVVLYPVLVQGDGAAEQICQAIEYFNETNSCDVIIVGRGGGSIEDLWEFNKEITARAIFNSKIPVISAVGHETDFTISDFVSDLRAPTPSAAAELAVPSVIDLKILISKLFADISYITQGNLRAYKNKVSLLGEKVSTRGILRALDNKRMYVLSLNEKVENIANIRISAFRERLSKNSAKLYALSPLKVLARGYSFATDEKNNVVKSIKGLKTGDKINLRVSDGAFVSEIKEIHKEKNNG